MRRAPADGSVRRGQRPAASGEREPDAPDDHQRQALELRRREPREHLVVASHELDQEALRPRRARDRARTASRGEGDPAAARAPMRRAHRERLVDRRRMDLLGRWARCRRDTPSPTAGRRRCRSRRRPRAGSRCGRSRSRARAPARTRSSSASPRKPRYHAQAKTANAPPSAPPYQTSPSPGEQAAEEVVADVVPVLGHVVDAGADEAPDQGRERRSRRPSRPACPSSLKRFADQRARRDEGEREHDPEGLKRQRAEVDLGLHARPSLCRAATRPAPERPMALLEVAHRVDGRPVDAHLEVEVVPEAVAGAADRPDHLALLDARRRRRLRSRTGARSRSRSRRRAGCRCTGRSRPSSRPSRRCRWRPPGSPCPAGAEMSTPACRRPQRMPKPDDDRPVDRPDVAAAALADRARRRRPARAELVRDLRRRRPRAPRMCASSSRRSSRVSTSAPCLLAPRGGQVLWRLSMPERVSASTRCCASIVVDRRLRLLLEVEQQPPLARRLQLQLAHAIHDRRVLLADPAHVVRAHEQVAKAVRLEDHGDEVGLVGLVDRDQARREHVLSALQLAPQRARSAACSTGVAGTHTLELCALAPRACWRPCARGGAASRSRAAACGSCR